MTATAAAVRGWDESAWSEQELRDNATFWRDDNQRPGDPGYHDPAAAGWRFDPAYPLARLEHVMADSEGWRCWHAAEVADFRSDGDGRAEDYEAMCSEPIEAPVILLERDGFAHVWDGYHRIAASFVANRSSIPAIVGEPR